MSKPETYTMLFSVDRMKVGCALLQSVHGCTIQQHPRWYELVEFWFADEYPEDAQVYEIREEQVPILIRKLNLHRVGRIDP